MCHFVFLCLSGCVLLGLWSVWGVGMAVLNRKCGGMCQDTRRVPLLWKCQLFMVGQEDVQGNGGCSVVRAAEAGGVKVGRETIRRDGTV